MAQTKEGAAKMRQTMIKKHGSEEAMREWYRNLGRKGGSVKGTQGGFASMTPEQRSEAGRKGGKAGKGKTYVRKQTQTE